MTDIELIDIIIKHLKNDNKPSGTNVNQHILNPKNITVEKEQLNRVLTILNGSIIESKIPIIANEPRILLSPEGMRIAVNFDSYSDYQESLKQSNRTINFHGQTIYNEQSNKGFQSFRDNNEDNAMPNPTPTNNTQIRIGVWGLILAAIGIIVMIILDVF